jgi:hypothetical protein
LLRPTYALPWHCLYFFPEPHGHGALRGVFDQSTALDDAVTAPGVDPGADPEVDLGAAPD